VSFRTAPCGERSTDIHPALSLSASESASSPCCGGNGDRRSTDIHPALSLSASDRGS
jgi:hypothetical protein